MAHELLTQLKSSLNENPNLNLEAKENLFLLSERMYQRMNLPTHLLVDRLKTVSLEQSPKFLDQAAYHYNMVENVVRFRVDKSDDHAHTLCQALLEMAIIAQPKKGMDAEEVVAIKKGTLEIFANNLVQNNGEYGISEDEQVIVNLMDTLTEGKILEEFVKDDSQGIMEALRENNLLTANFRSNYNEQSRRHGQRSQLGEIEISLINRFFEQSPDKIQRQMPDFEANLITSPQVMANPSQYMSLTDVKAYYQSKKMGQIAQMFVQPQVEELEKAK